MNIKKILRNWVVAALSEPKRIVKVNISQVCDGERFKGHTVVVTGGSKGIGYSIAKKLISEGAKVLITGRSEASLKEAVERLGANAAYIKFDSSDTDRIKMFLEECTRLLGKVDSMILNAGVSLHEGDFTHVTEQGFDKQFLVNLKANYFLAQAFIMQKLKANEDGNLLFVSSETAGKSNDLPYGLTKASINSLVGGLARRVYQRGIRVNAIAPGVTYTDMTKGNHTITDDYANNSAAGRFLLPEEIAEVACFLLSDSSKCITGEIMYCDAGSHLKINGFDNYYSL